ncbi:uncharacterized protein LOC124863138 [Girardinichthys multiradiatus]|uniref:uncharacterized protein LOC124863138 n=1 Tax=Girardinichthys multiradiatus TaxID=208333 RepID=UPI001FAD0372|nr:uncharacterized protein LOC124863138 [Girardinichthys multiradiatus]
MKLSPNKEQAKRVKPQVLTSTRIYVQAALNAVIGQTMPQRSQHPLVYILLIWTSILSIILLVFITLFFTQGQSSNSSTVGLTSPLHCTSCTTEILNLQAKPQELWLSNSTIEWAARQSTSNMIRNANHAGNTLHIKKDGNYILNLRVTLSACGETSVLDKSHSVALKLDGTVWLMGWTDTKSSSTVLLSKAISCQQGVRCRSLLTHLPVSTPVHR